MGTATATPQPVGSEEAPGRVTGSAEGTTAAQSRAKTSNRLLSLSDLKGNEMQAWGVVWEDRT